MSCAKSFVTFLFLRKWMKLIIASRKVVVTPILDRR